MDKHSKYISQEEQEIFERFLMKKMTFEEQKSFEINLTKDKHLEESFEEFKLLFEIIEEKSLREKLDGFHSEMKKEIPVKKMKPSKPNFNYRIAASIAILVSIAGLWFFNQQNPNEKLFEEYYSPDPGLPTVMGTNDNYAFYEAMVDYKQGNYDAAIEKWKKLIVAKPENDTLNYFLGAAYLANENTSEALVFFERTLNFKKSVFSKEARYFMALGQLKNGNTKKAIENLEMVSDEKSEALLKNIKE